MGSLVTRYHAIGSSPLGQSSSVTVTMLTFKLGGEPGAKLLERQSSTAIAETARVASRAWRAVWPVMRTSPCAWVEPHPPSKQALRPADHLLQLLPVPHQLAAGRPPDGR